MKPAFFKDMKFTRTSKPSGLAYPLEVVKQHLRNNGYDGENNITSVYISAAVDDISRWTWKYLQNATYTATLDGWNFETGQSDTVIIRMNPVTEITSIKYYDTNGDLQTMAAGTDYYVSLSGDFARVRFENMPTLRDQPFDNIEFTIKCGFETHFEIPEDLVNALLLLVSDKFENRQSLTSGMASNFNEIPMSIKSILDNNSLRTVG